MFPTKLPETPAEVEAAAAQFAARLTELLHTIGRTIVGYDAVVRDVLTSFIAGGHILLEGVPGLGKTLLAHTLADSVHQVFRRIQFTPDLMPADITGTTIVVEDPKTGQRRFVFQKGPVFGNIVLADEINRATPKTQSALLEAMQEATITVGGTRHELPQPFFVLATQNPIEMEGTYPLPEAQLDRFFFKLTVTSPAIDALVTIFDRTTQSALPRPKPVLEGEEALAMRALARQVPIAPSLVRQVAELIAATHPESDRAPGFVREYVRFGASPRGGQAIILASKVRALWDGRVNVAPEDIRAVAVQALRHRVLLNYEAEAERIRADGVVRELLDTLKLTA